MSDVSIFFVLFILYVFLAHLFDFFFLLFPLFSSFPSLFFFFFILLLFFCFLRKPLPPRTEPSPGPPSPGPPSAGPPKMSRFFPLSRHIFLSFFPLLGVFSLNFGGVRSAGALKSARLAKVGDARPSTTSATPLGNNGNETILLLADFRSVSATVESITGAWNR